MLFVSIIVTSITGKRSKFAYSIVKKGGRPQTRTYSRCMSPILCSLSLNVICHWLRNYSSSARNGQLLIFMCCYSSAAQWSTTVYNEKLVGLAKRHGQAGRETKH